MHRPAFQAGGNVDVANHSGDVLNDIANCKLANVSWVTPDGLWSDHPTDDPYGPSWVVAIVNAIGNSKACGPSGDKYWQNTAVVTWDDWGGWSDNQPAPYASSLPCSSLVSTPCERDYQYGFRVLLLVVSAYTPAHYINNAPHDFGSIVRFIEGVNGIKEGELGFADARGIELTLVLQPDVASNVPDYPVTLYQRVTSRRLMASRHHRTRTKVQEAGSSGTGAVTCGNLRSAGACRAIRGLPAIGPVDYPPGMLGGRSWSSWIAEYSESHQHPLNRLTHTLGIPIIIVSLPLALAAIVWHRVWPLALGLFVFGWVLQFIGHAIEGKPPEFLKDWRFLLVGSRWWLAKMQGKA